MIIIILLWLRKYTLDLLLPCPWDI